MALEPRALSSSLVAASFSSLKSKRAICSQVTDYFPILGYTAQPSAAKRNAMPLPRPTRMSDGHVHDQKRTISTTSDDGNLTLKSVGLKLAFRRHSVTDSKNGRPKMPSTPDRRLWESRVGTRLLCNYPNHRPANCEPTARPQSATPLPNVIFGS